MRSKSPLKGKLVLAVDDEPDMLDALEELLDMCQIIKKTDYHEAREYLETNHPDLVILDIMGVDGFNLLQQCVNKRLSAVMLTAHGLTLENLKRSIAIGARAYISKNQIGDIIPILEDVICLDHREAWNRLFRRLGGFYNSAFGINCETLEEIQM